MKLHWEKKLGQKAVKETTEWKASKKYTDYDPNKKEEAEEPELWEEEEEVKQEAKGKQEEAKVEQGKQIPMGWGGGKFRL